MKKIKERTALTRVGKFIVRHLKDKDLMQGELAQYANVSPAYVSSVVRGGYMPSAEFLHNTAEFLGLSQADRCDLFIEAFADKEHIFVRRDSSHETWVLISMIMALDPTYIDSTHEEIRAFKDYLTKDRY